MIPVLPLTELKDSFGSLSEISDNEPNVYSAGKFFLNSYLASLREEKGPSILPMDK